jgi:hypothetical protein
VPEAIRVDNTRLRGTIVASFGPSSSNLARLGRLTYWAPESDRRTPTLHRTVVSGGLFAALFNSRVKGLGWPDEGPYLSLAPDEPPLESERRFAHLFPPKHDKALRKKVAWEYPSSLR